MKTQTKKEKQEKVQAIRDLSARATDCTIIDSDYGAVEAWNLATCYIQNAEEMGNDLLTHVECALATESDNVRAYFATLGIKP